MKSFIIDSKVDENGNTVPIMLGGKCRWEGGYSVSIFAETLKDLFFTSAKVNKVAIVDFGGKENSVIDLEISSVTGASSIVRLIPTTEEERKKIANAKVGMIRYDSHDGGRSPHFQLIVNIV